MAIKIRRAAVLGAGVMGAQIAAQLAAAGVRTYLLDLATDQPPKDPKLAKKLGQKFRSARSIGAIEQLKQMKPAPLMSSSILPSIIPGNFDDDMSVLADVDWVIEVVAERLDIKKSIMTKVCEYARKDIPITTNTSGLSLNAIFEGFDEFLKRRFFGTHFFNPPRYMKLVEIIPHQESDMELVHSLATWIEERLGKGIVYAKDTINFIANRIGVFTLQASFQHMQDLGLDVETVDLLTGKLMGRPASATMRTMDVVGIDTFAHVARNVYDYAPDDPYRDTFLPPKWIENLIEKGSLGQKTGSVGAYKKTKEKGKTKILAFRPESGDYVDPSPQQFPWLGKAQKNRDVFARSGEIIAEDDDGAKFFWRVLRDTFVYSALLLEEIAEGDVRAVDDAIRWGFNWEWGPFELWQGVGFDLIRQKIIQDGCQLPSWCTSGLAFYQPSPGSIQWSVTGPTEKVSVQGGRDKIQKKNHEYYLPKRQNHDDERVVLSSSEGSLLDLGHGVACLVFHSKMNALNGKLIQFIQDAVAKVEEKFAGLVVANDGAVFSAGANLMEILESINQKRFDQVDQVIRVFQGTMQLLKYSSFPTVSCPHGLVLGGGLEVALHTSRQLLAGETYAGLVEAGVGLIPGGGGTKELALRSYQAVSVAENGDPMPFLQRAFLLIGMAKTSTSGAEAIEMGLFPQGASVSLSKDHQVERAKGMVLEMLNRGYVPPLPQQGVKVVGDPGIQTFKLMLYNMVQGGMISAYDAVIGEKIATILCGGEIDGGQKVDEQHFLDLERRMFVELCQEEKTKARIEAMLKTGKPLRN